MRTKKKPLKSQNGFTLIEIMITMAVMATALLAALTANAMISQTSEGVYQRLVAVQDANQVIERMRNTAATGTFPGNVTAVYPNGGNVAGFTSLTNETVTVTYVSAITNPLDVTVTVNYLENGRRAANTALRSLVTQRI